MRKLKARHVLKMPDRSLVNISGHMVGITKHLFIPENRQHSSRWPGRLCDSVVMHVLLLSPLVLPPGLELFWGSAYRLQS